MSAHTPSTFAVRAIWEGEVLTKQTGLDWEDAKDAYTSEEKFYLNLPDSHRAQGVTIQLFNEQTNYIEYELHFA